MEHNVDASVALCSCKTMQYVNTMQTRIRMYEYDTSLLWHVRLYTF